MPGRRWFHTRLMGTVVVNNEEGKHQMKLPGNLHHHNPTDTLCVEVTFHPEALSWDLEVTVTHPCGIANKRTSWDLTLTRLQRRGEEYIRDAVEGYELDTIDALEALNALSTIKITH